MTSKHSISSVALSAAIAFKLFAGTPDIAPILHDASWGLDGARFYAGRYMFHQATRLDRATDHRHSTCEIPRRCNSAGASTSPRSTAGSSTA